MANILLFNIMEIVVDYCIVSDDIIESVLFFHEHNHIPHLSDSAKLSVKLSAKFSHSYSSEMSVLGVNDDTVTYIYFEVKRCVSVILTHYHIVFNI